MWVDCCLFVDGFKASGLSPHLRSPIWGDEKGRSFRFAVSVALYGERCVADTAITIDGDRQGWRKPVVLMPDGFRRGAACC